MLKTQQSDSKSTPPPTEQPKPNTNANAKPNFVNFRQQKAAETMHNITKGKKIVQPESTAAQQQVGASLGKRRILPSQAGPNNGQKVVLISQPLSVKVPVTKSQGTPTQNAQNVNSRTLANQNVGLITTNQNIGPGGNKKIIYLNSQGQIIGQKSPNSVSIPVQTGANTNQPMRILVQNGDQMASRISTQQTNQQIKAVPSIVTSSSVSQPQAVTIQQQQATIHQQQKQAMNRNQQQVKNSLARLNHATPASPKPSPKPMVTNHQQIRPKMNAAPPSGAITIVNGNPQMTRMTSSQMKSLPMTSIPVQMTSSSTPPQMIIPSEMVKIEHDESEKTEPENDNGRKLTKDEERLLAELPTMMPSSKSEPKDESKSLKDLAKAQMMSSISYLVRLNLTSEEFNEVIEFSKNQLDNVKKNSKGSL